MCTYVYRIEWWCIIRGGAMVVVAPPPLVPTKWTFYVPLSHENFEQLAPTVVRSVSVPSCGTFFVTFFFTMAEILFTLFFVRYSHWYKWIFFVRRNFTTILLLELSTFERKKVNWNAVLWVYTSYIGEGEKGGFKKVHSKITYTKNF